MPSSGPVVLDTSYVMEGPPLSFEKEYLATSFVLGEIEEKGCLPDIEHLLNTGRIRRMDPTQEAEAAATDASQKMRLGDELSAPDLSVLALAIETRGCIWTFDLDIIRVAQELGLRTFPGIEAVSIHKAIRCSGCGAWLQQDQIDRSGAIPSKGVVGTCLICGSPARTKKVK